MAQMQSQIQKRGLAVSGRIGMASGGIEDKQQSMQINEMNGVSRQEHRSSPNSLAW